MENEEKDDKRTSRRNFLKLGAGVGAVAVASSIGSKLFALGEEGAKEGKKKKRHRIAPGHEMIAVPFCARGAA